MRRTHEQRRRLVPSEAVVEAIRYLLIYACQERADEVEVTAYCALSNHHHLLLNDRVGGRESKVSDFFRDFHAPLAKTLNRIHARSGVVWDPARSFDRVEVHGFEAEVAQWVYVAGQAVAAGLVERPEDWPGVCWLPEDVGRTLTARRPEFLYSTRQSDPDDDFDDQALREARELLQASLKRSSEDDKRRGRSPRRRRQLAQERERRGRARLPQPPPAPPPPLSDYPEEVSYTVPPPRCMRGWEIEDVRVYLRAALDAYVARIHEERRSEGKGFLGPEGLQDQDPHTPPPGTKVDTDSPATYQRAPAFATRGLEKEVVDELKSELLQWHADYREALVLLRSPAPQRARFPRGAHLRAHEERRLRLAYRAQAPPRAA